MNWISVKTASAVKLAGITLDFTLEDGAVKSCQFTDAEGNTVRCTQESYSIFRVLVPEPPKKEERFILHGSLPTGKYREVFETDRDARAKRSELQGAFSLDIDLEISPADVVVADDGSVKADDIPF